MNFTLSERLRKLPPYIFSQMENVISEKKKQDISFISLSIGDPDLPPPDFILNALKKEAADPKNHNYSFSQGEPDFKDAVSVWYKKRFKVDLDSENEVAALIGSKEGMANFVRAFINTGDRVLVPDPAYPVYENGGTLLSEGIPITMPLCEENDFLPDLVSLPTENVKMAFLNYPNNPTSATLNRDYLKAVVEWAKENNIILCYDNAYSEITFGDYKAPSILEIEGAKDVAVEFHSCSKTFNITGDRIGFAAGNSQLIKGLIKVKTQIDSGPPVYIQKVAIKALESYPENGYPEFLKNNNQIISDRCDILIKGLNNIGVNCKKPKGTFYVWSNLNRNSMEITLKLIDAGVIVTPGIGFGKQGENYIRFSLTRPKEEIQEACQRMAKTLS